MAKFKILDVVVIYPNKVLLEQDQEQWDQVKELMKPGNLKEGEEQFFKHVSMNRYSSLAEAIP